MPDVRPDPSRATPPSPGGHRSSRWAPGLLAAVLLVAPAGAVTGCTGGGDSLQDAAGNSDNRGYLPGSGAIERLPASSRNAPLTLSGTTLDGKTWSLAEQRGNVVVVNVWGSWCAPCEQEMPHLQSVWSAMSKAGQPVRFIGVNVRESYETAAAAARRYGLTYPSLADDGGQTVLALQGKAAATPTTLVLDRSGRIAARVSGPVTGPTTLRDLINDVVAEPGTPT